MITPSQAAKLVKDKNPGRTIGFGVNYDSNYYVFGLRNKNVFEVSGDDEPFFGVEKKTGNVVNFIPDDYSKFFNLLQTNSLNPAIYANT